MRRPAKAASVAAIPDVQSGPTLASGSGVEGSVVKLNRQVEMAHVLTCVPQIPD